MNRRRPRRWKNLKWKKLLSMLLVLAMVFSIDAPLAVRAENEPGGVMPSVVSDGDTAAEETETPEVSEENVTDIAPDAVTAEEGGAGPAMEEILPVYANGDSPAIYHAGKGQREKTTIYQGSDVLDIYVTPSYHIAEMTAFLPVSMRNKIDTANGEDASYLRVSVKYREQGGAWNTNIMCEEFDETDYTAKLSFSYLESGTTYEFEISLEHKDRNGGYSSSYSWENVATFEGSGTPVRTTTLTSTQDVIFEVQQTGSLVAVYSCIPNPGTNGSGDWGISFRKKGESGWGNYEKGSEISLRGEALDYISVEPDTDYEFALIHYDTGYEDELEPAALEEVHTGPYPADIRITPTNITKSTADIEVNFSNFTGFRLVEFDGSYRPNFLQFLAKTEGTNRIDVKFKDDFYAYQSYTNIEADATSGTVTLSLKNLDAGKSYSLPIWVRQTDSGYNRGVWYLAGKATFTTQSSEIAGKTSFSVAPKAGSSTELSYSVNINAAATDNFADSYSYDIYYRVKNFPNNPKWLDNASKTITKDPSQTPRYQASGTISGLYAGATYLVYLVIDDKVYTQEVATSDGAMVPTVTLTPLQYGARLDVTLDGATSAYKIKAYSSSKYGNMEPIGLADVGSSSSVNHYKMLYASDPSGSWIARGFAQNISSSPSYDSYDTTYKPDTDYLFCVEILDEDQETVYEEYIPYHTEPINLDVLTQSISGVREKVIVCFPDADDSVWIEDRNLPMELYYRVKGSDSAWKKDTYGLYLSTRYDYEYGYNQMIYLAERVLKNLSAETTYEVKITSTDYQYGYDDTVLATGEFTTAPARENGAFKDVELVFNGFEAQLHGTYLMSDYADHARVYLQQLDQSGAVVHANELHPNEFTGIFDTKCISLKKETESVRLHADEYARDWSYDNKDNPVKTTDADPYTRPGKPQVEFTAAKVTPGVNRLFVNLAYTGDMCLTEDCMAAQHVSVDLKYGTGTDESQWSTKSCYGSCFYRYGDQQQNVVLFKDLEAGTTYHGKVLVRVLEGYSSDDEFYRWEIDLGSFTTGTDESYTLATIFPDEALRNMVISEARLGSSATQITASQLEQITGLQSYRNNFDKPAVRSLAGLEKLKALQYLDLERHEISDVSNVDWSKLAMLVRVGLQGNDLTRLPDLSGNAALVTADFSQNKLSAAELATASSKIPAGVNASYYNQRPDGLTVIAEDTYYQRSGQSVLVCKPAGYKSSLPYTFKFKVDGTEITDWDRDSDIYYHENTGLSVGSHSLEVEMYANGVKVETSAAKTFTIAAAKATAYKPLYYWNSNQNGINIYLYADKPFNGVSMRRSGSQTVVAQPDEPVNCYSTREEGRYRKLGYIYLSDTQIYCGSAWLEKVDNATLTTGSYDVVVEYEDGTTDTITGLVTVTDSAVITDGTGAYENYDNAGEYIYLYISGYAFDPARLAFTFENRENGIVYDAAYVSAKQEDSRHVLKFRKGENWMADIRKSKGYSAGVNVKMAAAGGYSAVFETDSFEAGGTSDLPYLAYNPAAGNIEALASSKLAGTAVTYTLRRYATSNEMWNDDYDTLGEGIELQVEKTRGTLSYLKPVKDGKPYALPDGYYKVRLKYRNGGETRHFELTGSEQGKQLSVYANNSTLPATLKLYRPYDTEAAATVTITQSDLQSGRYYFTRSLIEQLADRKAFYELVITYADGFSRYFEKMSLGTADGAEDDPTIDDPEPPAEVRYTVTFSMQGHGGAVPAQNVKSGEKAVEPPTPTAAGYIFGGWYKDSGYQTKWNFASDVITGPTTIYARWLAEYTITYMDGDTAMTGLTPAVYGAGIAVRLPAAAKTGFIFKGWYEKSDLSGTAVTSIAADSTGNKTFYAKWAVAYKITYMDGDTVMSGLSPAVYEEGVETALPTTATKEGFTFAGWYAAKDLTGEAVTKIPAGSRSDQIFYAKWTENKKEDPPKTFTVTFNANGGSAVAAQTVEEGKTAEKPADPTRTGFTFGGWYTDAACKTAYQFDTAVTADVTLYAKWTETGKEGFWVSAVEPQDYTGSAIKPAVKVYDGAKLLKANTDYTVAYKNNTNAGNATITVTGKGNYIGKETVTFVILPLDLNSDGITMSLLWEAYTGSAINPVPTVKFGGKALKNNTDFTLSYPGSGYVEEGTYPVKVTGMGNFTGDRTLEFGITRAKLISSLKVAAIKNQPYNNGDPVTPEVTVKDGRKTLERGTDYELSYRNNVDAGKATVIITGTGENYAGVKEVSFNITGTQMSKVQIGGVVNKIYNGRPQTQDDLRVTYKGETLDEEEDYTVSYTKNVAVGTATITLTGRKGFTGTKKKTFRITAYDIKSDPDGLVAGGLADDSVVYTKGGSTPDVELTFDGDPMVAKTDFSVSYSNNKKVASASAKKAPTVTVNGKGNFKGKRSFNFEITKNDFNSDATVFVTVPDVKYAKGKGKYISKPVLVDSKGKKLAAGTDYESKIKYTLEDDTALDKNSTVPAGKTVTATITGKGYYEGTLEVTYRITEKSFGSAKITIDDQEYTGEAITVLPKDVTVKMNGDTLTYGTDYEILEGSYLNNVKKGKNSASVIIRGLGEYGGNKTVKFNIKAKKID